MTPTDPQRPALPGAAAEWLTAPTRAGFWWVRVGPTDNDPAPWATPTTPNTA